MVSIIITLYNKEKSIRRAILSAINQTYRDIEIIVIDDCSTDDSKKICEEYNENIKLYSTEKNSGLPHSRNLGIEIAQGEFITFIDADDYLNHDAILECVNEHKRTNADIVQMKITRRISKLNIPIRFRSKYNKSMALDACLYNEHLFPVQCWGKLYKTELLKAVTPIKYDGFWGEDRIFNIPLFASNPNIAIAKKAQSSAFVFCTLTGAIAVIVLEVLGKTDYATIISLPFFALLTSYFVLYWIYQKRG